jgi:hypothetical protein
MVTNLPAQVCRQCGEQTFSTQTLTVMQGIRDGLAPPPRVSTLHVYDFEDIETSRETTSSDLKADPARVVVASSRIEPTRSVTSAANETDS